MLRLFSNESSRLSCNLRSMLFEYGLLALFFRLPFEA